jgi:3-oxoacyl-[acyl-carrier protein] reductase
MKRVLLTGGSRGLGKAIQNYLEACGGYSVTAPSRGEMNLGDTTSIEQYLSSNSDFDVVINNAGLNILSSVDAFSDEMLDQMLQVNLRAVMQILRKMVPGMKTRGYGRIVNVSSIWGVRSKENRSMYSLTKFGLNGITRALARELGPFGVLVNSVCPGYMNTEMTQQNVPEEDQRRICGEIPLRRFAEPRELAVLIEFLASDRNTYLTGQDVIADGGFLA